MNVEIGTEAAQFPENKYINGINSTIQRCPNKIIKIFLLESFCHLPPVSLTPVANLDRRISPRIFEKIRNSPNVIIRGLGKLIQEKKQKQKISWHCPFKGSLSSLDFKLKVFFHEPVSPCPRITYSIGTISNFCKKKYFAGIFVSKPVHSVRNNYVPL